MSPPNTKQPLTAKEFVEGYNKLITTANSKSPLFAVMQQLLQAPPSTLLAPIEASHDERSCAGCSFFSVPKESLGHVANDVDVVGWCIYWDEPSSAAQVCDGYDEGLFQIL